MPRPEIDHRPFRLDSDQRSLVEDMMVEFPSIMAPLWKVYPGTVRAAKEEGISDEEIEQAGWVGVVRAAATFENWRGLKFSTYAIPFARSTVQRLHFKPSGYSPAVSIQRELTRHHGMTIEDFRELSEMDPEPSFIASEWWDDMMRWLPEREASILRMRYQQNMTLAEIASHYRCSTAHLKSLAERAIDKLRRVHERQVATT